MLKRLIGHGHSMREIAPPRGETGLFCMAGGAGFELRANEVYSWDGLQRGGVPFALIQHTISGEGRLDFSGVSHRVRPGETMLLTFPHAHRYWLAPGGVWQYFWIILKGREALRVAGSVLAATGPILRPPQIAIDAMAGACLELLEQTADMPGAVSSASYRALMALYDAAVGVPEDEAPYPVAVQRVVSYIENNLAQRMDVGLLAQVAGMSRSHFVRTFVGAVGVAPSTYVFDKRIQRAARLLVATDHSVGKVAAGCGFSDANYFSKAFRRAQGMAPGVYRNAARFGRS